MEEQKFIINFSKQFDETDPELIEFNTKFRDLDEWSSLTALSVMAMSDEQYGVSLTAEDLGKSTTIADIYRIIKSKL